MNSVVLPNGVIDRVSVVCIGDDEVVSGLGFHVDAGIVRAEVKPISDVGTLVTLGGTDLMFNNMLIFKPLNYRECST